MSGAVSGGMSGAVSGSRSLLYAPVLVLCWLCCWSDDCSDGSASEAETPKPIISIVRASRRRSNELSGRRLASSAVSLHLPSTSGQQSAGTSQPLSAFSHEEIRSRRKSHHDSTVNEARYHSAPSVIDEVLHRRDWERSSKDLYVPLKPPNDKSGSISSNDTDRQSLDNTSVVERTDEEIVGTTCKKHHTNIKSSRRNVANKESLNEDVKDQDATENTVSNFYIGDASCQLNAGEFSEADNESVFDDVKLVFDGVKSPKAKETKQCLNECIRSKDRPRKALVPVTEFQVSNVFEIEDLEDMDVDRSGAVHHSVESRSSLFGTHAIPFPPPSVEAVGYDSDASYLEESVPSPSVASWRRVAGAPAALGLWARSRHASVGDVLAPSLTLRPQSGALSESDLDFELEGCDEPPPAYDEVQLLAVVDRKETAI